MNKILSTTMTALLTAAFALPSQVFAAKAWHIGAGDIVALTNALAQYANNDVIELAPGEYRLSGYSSARAQTHLYRTANQWINVTIRGESAENTVLIGGGVAENMRILCIIGPFTISNLTFTAGYANGANMHGGAVLVSSDFPSSITDCIFSNNFSSVNGGAVYAGTKLSRCRFINNSADGSGGASAATKDVTDCIYINNIAKGHGGATSYGGPYKRCAFVGNLAKTFSASCGGAVYGSTCIDCGLTNNAAMYWGGAGYAGSYTGCSIVGNGALKSGSALHAYTSATDCEFIDNVISNGSWGTGAVHGGVVSNCVFRGNRGDSTSYGTVLGGKAKAYNCTFIGNIGEANGMIYDSTLWNCRVLCNTNFSIYNSGCLIRGGLSGATSKLYNTLLVDNVSTNDASLADATQFYNCTIVGQRMLKTAAANAAVWPTALLVNTIVTGTSSVDIPNNALLVMTNSIWTTGSATLVKAVNCIPNVPTAKIFFTDPANADYSIGDRRSKAFDAGSDGILAVLPATDLAGNPRLKFNHIDIGAYECILNPAGTVLCVQ